VALTVGTDSYATIDEADEYFFSGYFGAEAWEEAGSDEKEAALKSATRRIDRLTFRGVRADPDQVLQFPRAYSGWVEGELTSVADNGILPNVKRACFEEALAALQGEDLSKRALLQKQGVTSARIGTAAETYSGVGMRQSLASVAAYDNLRNYIAGPGALG
jgi:hypothetical protein